MTLAYRVIRSEHFEIKLILTCLHELAKALQMASWKPDFDLLFLILHYIESFPETFHHPKEEDYLFKAIRRRSPQSEPLLDQLCDEHAQGIELMTDLRTALRAYAECASACTWFCDTARSYVDYERAHIEHEERTVLPLSLQVLKADDWLEINTAFAENQHPLLGPVRQAQFDKLFSLILRLVPGAIVFGVRKVSVA